MCGVVGVVARDQPPSLANALAAMQHRGPDAADSTIVQLSNAQVALGHARLSILDLTSEANQPFWNDARSHVIVFNGEIYNHHALRSELAANGTHFRTRSDTEVLLAACAQSWDAKLGHLNGMFAFALLDIVNERLLLVRDPFGIKPLYYTQMPDGGLAFASEIRALAAVTGRHFEIDRSCIAEFLLNGFLYEPHTGFADVQKVPSGHLLEVDLRSFKQTLRPHPQVPHTKYRHSPSADSFTDLLRQEMALQCEADVPVGIFFSGGIDSSALAAAAPAGGTAFFVDYGDDTAHGDSPYVEETARILGVALRSSLHRDVDVSPDELLDEFRQVAAGTEEPISDYTYLATRVIARAARDAGFKVMLSGMGADELFAGYPRQIAAGRWNLARQLRAPIHVAARALANRPSWDKRIARLLGFVDAGSFAEAYTSLVGYFSRSEVDRLLGDRNTCQPFLQKLNALLGPVQHESLLQQAIHLDRLGFLQHNLTVVDRASMACSIELRVPFLTPDMGALSAAMDNTDLVRGMRGKLPLRRYLQQHLPRRLVERPKVGFNPPLDRRIRALGEARVSRVLAAGALAGVLDQEFVQQLVTEHFAGAANHTYRLWQLLYLHFWFEVHAGGAQTVKGAPAPMLAASSG